jgi:galactokinase
VAGGSGGWELLFSDSTTKRKPPLTPPGAGGVDNCGENGQTMAARFPIERAPFSMSQTVSSTAPGRVELLGNHTDYNQGVVLSAAINLGIAAHGSPRDDGRIVLSSEGNPRVEIVEKPAAIESGRGWADYPLGVAKMLARAGHPVGGFEARFDSTLPSGAGLSSSAALEVATAVLLCKLFGLEIEPMELARICRRAENEFVGVQCGLLDQVSSIFGQGDHAVYLDCRTESVSRILIPDGAALLLVHSGVKHALIGGEYNNRREACFAAAARLGVTALRDTDSATVTSSDLPDELKRRALHIVGENERVLRAVEFLKAGDLGGFGGLMTASHESSRINFENSTPELDQLVAIAVATDGVHGARLTGGGFGGAIVALVDRSRMDEIAESLVARYAATTSHTGTAYRCTIGDGAILDA